ncbi:hypothetical protein NEOLEDRAFT_566076 [Neolentinus lepideus HHB14362 ss-1]|uniref:Uncharacterized protein n=1 Tax=Neolentinus lepideus HHB14362 ss-1 TaxID=1314782 RepID=A0A165R3G7_9AGAM|nr:hypothetical protein NEOLEDRAFT_566076 [Neolentinus lepideus HHB14362 ss-1]
MRDALDVAQHDSDVMIRVYRFYFSPGKVRFFTGRLNRSRLYSVTLSGVIEVRRRCGVHDISLFRPLFSSSAAVVHFHQMRLSLWQMPRSRAQNSDLSASFAGYPQGPRCTRGDGTSAKLNCSSVGAAASCTTCANLPPYLVFFPACLSELRRMLGVWCLAIWSRDAPGFSSTKDSRRRV